MEQFFGGHEVHLRDYLYVLRKRRSAIILSFIAIVGLSIFLTYRETVLYKAVTTILIERDNPNVVDFKEVMAFDASTTDYYQTQHQMLASLSLINALIESEGLDEDPYFQGQLKSGFKRFLREQEALPSWLLQFVQIKSPADIFGERMLKIEPVPNTRLVRLSVLHPDPAKSARLTNALIQLFIQKNLESRFMISSQASQLLADQLTELKEKVTAAEHRLQEYKEENHLMNIPSIHEKNKFIQDAKLELVKIQADEARLAKRYLPAHPKFIHIRSQREALAEKIREEEAKDLEFSRIAVDYSQYERESESERKTYEALLSRFQQMQSEAETQSSNIMVIDPATPPIRPFKPRPFMNLTVGCFLGLLVGFVLAFFSEYLDATVKIPDDIEKGLGLELFGIVPFSVRDRKGPARGEIFLSQGKPSQAAESFRALRTAILFKLRHVPGCRTLLVTSPNPEEGKSTVSLNLAAAFQQNHLKVLIIDADLRKPKLHKRLGVDAKAGLSEVLEKEMTLDQAVHKDAQQLGFDFLSCGRVSHHPTEILGSQAMKDMLVTAKEIYDVIVIDSPPFLAVADVAVLSEYSDSLIAVARYQKTERRHLRDIKRRFSMIPANAIGIVINFVSVRERDYYYHQYYYYGYGDSRGSQ